MRVALAAVAAVAILAVVAVATGTADPGRAGCAPPSPTAGYTASVLHTLRDRSDGWGEALLGRDASETREGPARFLSPLLLAGGPGQTPLTQSGFHYVALSFPGGPDGAQAVALHVADGSQVVADHVGGRTLTVRTGSERYGSCFGRLTPGTLAEGWLPILETRYEDAAGNRYTQESFAGRRPLASFVRVTVESRQPGALRLEVANGEERTLRFAAGTHATLRVTWAGGSALAPATEAEYRTARAAVVAYWKRRLAQGPQVRVPDPTVMDAWRAVLAQDLALSWRYSIGNPYEEFSFPEGLDVAQVMAEWGEPALSRWIVTTSLSRSPTPYPNWKKGEKLVAAGTYYRLFRDRAYIASITPALRAYVDDFHDQLAQGGRLAAERYSSDIPDTVHGLHTEAVVWEGLMSMASAWTAVGDPADATRARETAAGVARGLRASVARSQRRLADGSLFVPVSLDAGERPYGSVTEARLGSYWNLVMPYALASGFFRPGSTEARGIFRYMRLHGSRLLGLVRAGAYALYGQDAAFPAGGTDEVYGINVARFLADEGEADQLVLSLYGQLAVSMTPGTFVSGEAAEVAPNRGSYVRATYLPPNAASNAAFLTKLRLLLVHETRDARAAPTGLQLAFATPRTWLAPGRRIAVERMPTSFGPVSFDLRAGARSVRATVRVPARRPARLALRLRLPGGRRIASVTFGGAATHRFDARSGTIDLTGRHGTVQVVAATTG